MASAPQPNNLPLLYKEIVPISQQAHASWKARRTDKASWLVDQHIVPLTVEEFPLAQRHYPIVFSASDTPVPLALMGMSAGNNVFIEDDGSLRENVYLPAYARRYPFLLAKLRPDSEEMSLCMDPTSDLVGEFEDGTSLFENGEPSQTCQDTLKFCEQFEVAGNKTGNFVQELLKHDLLTEGSISVQPPGEEQPFNFTGFKMVNQDKLKELRGDVLRTWNQNGMLPLIFAHLFSLELTRDIFSKQAAQGKTPERSPA